MTAAIDLCWAAGCFKIMLLSGEQNTKAHAFYERLGFKRSKTGFDLRKLGYAPRKGT
ncbi:GNAT family N-acetyltransferase [Roseibium sp. HPY-6]|uniref:GNAT family N-acetyltransferase n=1 Tax=Roseibium sp. HPY-6 TaxID=3229852 RepID=UPI00338F7A11